MYKAFSRDPTVWHPACWPTDTEGKARADFEIRWWVALGIEIEKRPFAKNTCQVFRAQLILHNEVWEVFERSLRLAREVGYLKRGRGMRVALDTTYILGRETVSDTYNLLADGIVKLMRAHAAVSLRQRVEAHGYKRYAGSIVKGEAAIDWSNRRARRKLLGEIAADADWLLQLVRRAQEGMAADSHERTAIVDAAELLGQLLLQDVMRGGTDGDARDDAHAEGEVVLKDGVKKDRMMSVHDPETRHGHKCKSRRFEGQKAAVVVDTHS